MSTSIALIVERSIEERGRLTPIEYAKIAIIISRMMSDYHAYLAVQRLVDEREQELLGRFRLPVDIPVLRLQIDANLSFFLLQDGQLLYFYRYPGSDAVAYGRIDDASHITEVLGHRRPLSIRADYNRLLCEELLREIERAKSLPWGTEVQNYLEELTAQFHRPLPALSPAKNHTR